MGVTVNANGLSVVHQGSGGVANADIPDVCMTKVGKPIKDLPYQNTAESSDLAGGSTTVTADGGSSIAIQGSTFSKSTGDEAGDKKGIKSGTIKGEAEFTTQSATVKIEGKGVCRLSDQMSMNEANTMCLSGVQNPSVSVSADDVGTFTVSLHCHYPNGTPLKNAQFEIVDESGDVAASGTLDDSGQAIVSGLAEMQFSLRFMDTDTPYIFNQYLSEQFEQSIEEHSSYFSAASGQKCLFWEDRIGTPQRWGLLRSKRFADRDFADMVHRSASKLSPMLASATEYRHFTAQFVSALDELQTERDNEQVYKSFAHSLFPLCIKEGRSLQQLTHVNEETLHSTLLLAARNLGTGNAQHGLTELDWSQYGQQIVQFLSELTESLCYRLSYIKTHARYCNYGAVIEIIEHYEKEMKAVEQILPELMERLLVSLGEQISNIVLSAPPELHTNVSHAVFNSSIGDISVVVETNSAESLKGPLYCFKNSYSE
ncbi:PAAR-like domain-containing protein [Thaumasiovibrio sp. DFM-14]|uniref:PAAR-like domain-containing protein n=1 Tax=Thaumasiovibrio sp. DFM-14 TaxID=3384792 RepID=UPI0039A0FADF